MGHALLSAVLSGLASGPPIIALAPPTELLLGERPQPFLALVDRYGASLREFDPTGKLGRRDHVAASADRHDDIGRRVA